MTASFIGKTVARDTDVKQAIMVSFQPSGSYVTNKHRPIIASPQPLCGLCTGETPARSLRSSLSDCGNLNARDKSPSRSSYLPFPVLLISSILDLQNRFYRTPAHLICSFVRPSQQKDRPGRSLKGHRHRTAEGRLVRITACRHRDWKAPCFV